jgi:hypothetical protein
METLLFYLKFVQKRMPEHYLKNAELIEINKEVYQNNMVS